MDGLPQAETRCDCGTMIRLRQEHGLVQVCPTCRKTWTFNGGSGAIPHVSPVVEAEIVDHVGK